MKGSGQIVLIVDDDPAHLRIYSMILVKEGFQVRTALVGSSTVELEADHADVVALDYRLNSRLSATDVARMVQERFPGAPIVVLSELEWMPEDIAPMASAFVQKGNPAELLQTLAKVCTRD